MDLDNVGVVLVFVYHVVFQSQEGILEFGVEVVSNGAAVRTAVGGCVGVVTRVVCNTTRVVVIAVTVVIQNTVAKAGCTVANFKDGMITVNPVEDRFVLDKRCGHDSLVGGGLEDCVVVCAVIGGLY